jgi:hypothetical protein
VRPNYIGERNRVRLEQTVWRGRGIVGDNFDWGVGSDVGAWARDVHDMGAGCCPLARHSDSALVCLCTTCRASGMVAQRRKGAHAVRWAGARRGRLGHGPGRDWD